MDFGNGRAVLSSGYQAIIRLLVELLYYQDMVIRRMKISSAWIVIDELDEFLSPRYSAVILEFERLFGNHDKPESPVENILRRLLNNKINQAWGEEDEVCLTQLNRQRLTASQQMIVRQIQEW